MMEEDRRAAEGQARALTKDLENDITELKSRDAELEQILHADDHLHILQVCVFICVKFFSGLAERHRF